jgi:TnpA family transposase
VLWTEFLLKYLGSAELRALIQAATNKRESFNGFAQWAAFGGQGTILTNDRYEQRKSILCPYPMLLTPEAEGSMQEQSAIDDF